MNAVIFWTLVVFGPVGGPSYALPYVEGSKSSEALCLEAARDVAKIRGKAMDYQCIFRVYDDRGRLVAKGVAE